jgi:ABC-type nitrate/sulfonate/bicarbonate transport system substrate-binding protein
MNAMFRRALLAWLVVLASASASDAAAPEKIRVGYWTSGFSIGFGAVLEAGHFLEKQGLAPDYVRFTDVNGPTKALLTHSIDVAFAAPATGAFTLGIQGAPVQIVLATQIAEATFVARENAPLRSLADLKGRKLGMSPAGSATYAIVAAILERNYGLTTANFVAVPGNEGPLVNFLQRGDIDAAALRAVTIASLPGPRLKTLGGLVTEWKKMTRTNAVPILGVSLAHRDFLREHPNAAVAYLRAVIDATRFGAAEPAKASEILSRTANLDVKDARSYVNLWNQIYLARLEPQDIATLKTMADIFRKSGTIEGAISDGLFNAAPYEKVKAAP